MRPTLPRGCRPWQNPARSWSQHRCSVRFAGLFIAEELGSHELKGVPEAVTLFRLVRASGGGRRAGQRHLTPLIGREEEIDLLMRRWKRGRDGDGQLVLIVG